MKRTLSSVTNSTPAPIPSLRAELESIVLPELYCPFPPNISPNAEVVDQHALKWASSANVVTTDEAYNRIAATRIGWLLARAYPNTPLEAMRIIAEWTTWGFIWDDFCGQPGVAKQPDKLTAVYSYLVDILNGAMPKHTDEPLVHALCDLRQQIGQRVTSVCMKQFIRSVEEFFVGCAWEATNRSKGLVPDVTSYIRMRPYTGGLYTYFALFELTEQHGLPPAVQNNPLVRRLSLMASNVVCWVNDIISLSKELKHNDVHNLVLVLQHKYGTTLQQAVDRAAALHDAEVKAFIDLESRLPSFGQEADIQLERYIAMLRCWMRGNLEWSYTSGRYLLSTMVAVE